MNDVVLVLNAGSSSLKFEVFGIDGGEPSSILGGKVEELTTAAVFEAKDAAGRRIGSHRWPADAPPGHDGAIAWLSRWLAEQLPGKTLRAVGHRVVHGGTKYHAPVRVDAGVLADLERLVPLAPLHQPHNLSGIRAVAAQRPDLPQVACFDTAFHTTQHELAQMFALPHRFGEAGVRRYGFHGLSYEYIASVLPTLDARAAAGRTVVAHLGNGASLCAMAGGRSVASTMGFTALEGLPMGTRCGQIDPGVLIYLMDEHGMDARAIERLLYKESGLLGVSGRSSDMRELLAAGDDARCRLAVDLFCYRAAREIGSLAAALGGLDAIVFTAGIGEHAAPVRERILCRCAWLGVELDEAANAAGGALVTTAGSRVAAWVVPTDEEGMIARHTLALLNGARTPRGPR
ncbi:MAG: acetate/propionate family kinase [Burkholderiaceae bacterium]|jgi:acetate kinase|nr:acetate/propionate family kinase [Burkholderiaceae bacterium]